MLLEGPSTECKILFPEPKNGVLLLPFGCIPGIVSHEAVGQSSGEAKAGSLLNSVQWYK